MRQGIVPPERSIIEVELLTGSNSRTRTRGNITDVILMCEAMKTTDFQVKMDNTNPETPEKSTEILRYSFLAREKVWLLLLTSEAIQSLRLIR